MKVNWEKEKSNLEKLIKEGVAYEFIGRQYGVTGTAVKKAAIKLGIDIPERRKINPNEHFNKGKGKKRVCYNCGKDLSTKSWTTKYCSIECQNEYRRKEYILKWKNGDVNGVQPHGFTISNYVRRYIFEKNGNKCEICGCDKTNPFTGNSILQIHHIDGDCLNNKEENLQLLCPNCHAMTDNYGSRNKNATPGRSKYFGKANQ